MKKVFRLAIPLIVLAFAFVISSCRQKQPEKITLKGEALGTFYTIHVYHEYSDPDYGKVLQQKVDSLLSHFNSVASVYDSASVISCINKNLPYNPDSLFTDVFKRSIEISDLSGGAFDITVGPLVNAWGFGFTDSAHITQEFLDSVLQFTGYQKVRLADNKVVKDDERIMLDMNAIAKGYAVDLVSLFLESQGIESYIVEIGGEVRTGALKPDGSKWVIAVEKPAESADAAQEEEKRIFLTSISVATSGTYRKYYERNGVKYSHTIDPKTGRPVSHNLLSATIIAPDCMTADALATACMVLGKDEALQLCMSMEGVEGFFIVADEDNSYKTFHTPGFEAYLREK